MLDCSWLFHRSCRALLLNSIVGGNDIQVCSSNLRMRYSLLVGFWCSYSGLGSSPPSLLLSFAPLGLLVVALACVYRLVSTPDIVESLLV